MNRALFTSDSAEWGTPRAVFDWLNAMFAFTVDVCAQPTNAKLPRFFTPRDNGLAQSWEGETFFCNPVYGRAIGGWCDKARDSCLYERAMGALLIPARVDTDWWNLYVLSADGKAGRLVRSWFEPSSRVWWLRWEGLVTGVYFHDQRLTFEGAADDGAPFPSAVVFHASPSRRPAIERPALEPGARWLTKGWPR